MTPESVMMMGTEAMKIAIAVAAPLLLVALVTGLIISILQAATQIMIMPGFTYRLTSGMITNFHQPKSTLLLLVSAFIGEEWRRLYDYALSHGFRFLSYGDSSLLLP